MLDGRDLVARCEPVGIGVEYAPQQECRGGREGEGGSDQPARRRHQRGEEHDGGAEAGRELLGHRRRIGRDDECDDAGQRGESVANWPGFRRCAAPEQCGQDGGRRQGQRELGQRGAEVAAPYAGPSLHSRRPEHEGRVVEENGRQPRQPQPRPACILPTDPAAGQVQRDQRPGKEDEHDELVRPRQAEGRPRRDPPPRPPLAGPVLEVEDEGPEQERRPRDEVRVHQRLVERVEPEQDVGDAPSRRSHEEPQPPQAAGGGEHGERAAEPGPLEAGGGEQSRRGGGEGGDGQQTQGHEPGHWRSQDGRQDPPQPPFHVDHDGTLRANVELVHEHDCAAARLFDEGEVLVVVVLVEEGSSEDRARRRPQRGGQIGDGRDHGEGESHCGRHAQVRCHRAVQEEAIR
jgi:hypothetical protein